MDADTIIGCRAKLGRTVQLLKAIEGEWRAFLDNEPWPSRVEDGCEPGWHTIYFDFTG